MCLIAVYTQPYMTIGIIVHQSQYAFITICVSIIHHTDIFFTDIARHILMTFGQRMFISIRKRGIEAVLESKSAAVVPVLSFAYKQISRFIRFSINKKTQ